MTKFVYEDFNFQINRTVVFRAVDSLIDGTITPHTTTPTTSILTTPIPTNATTPPPTTPTPTNATTPKPTSPPTTPPTSILTTPIPTKPTTPITTKPTTDGSVKRKKRDISTPSYGQRYHYFSIQCNAIPKGVVDHVIGHVGVK